MSDFINHDARRVATEKYLKLAHPFTRLFAEDILRMIPVCSGDNVLDIAAGTGAFTIPASESGAQILATDLSNEMLRHIEEKKIVNVSTKVMDGQNIPLADSSFDAVFSLFGVTLFPDWRKGLSEMARLTRPGGVGVVATWAQGCAGTNLLVNSVCKKLFNTSQTGDSSDSQVLFKDAGGLSRELIKAGFKYAATISLSHDYLLDMLLLDQPDELFGMSSDWSGLNEYERRLVTNEIRSMAGSDTILSIPSESYVGIAGC